LVREIKMAEVFLICGKIASGKTTYAKQISAKYNAVLLSFDEIMMIFSEAQCAESHDNIIEGLQNYLLRKSLEFINAGISVILDWGFWTQEERNYINNFYMVNKIKKEWHYIDVSPIQWRRNIKKRIKSVLNSVENWYYFNDGKTQNTIIVFEQPKREEMDVWYCNKEEM